MVQSSWRPQDPKAFKACRLLPWRTLVEANKVPPCSSMPRHLMGSRYWCPATKWWFKVKKVWLPRKSIGTLFLLNLLWLRSCDRVFLALPSGAGGELQTYQIRTASAAGSLPQTVVTNSPVGLSQLKLDDPTVKREIRLAKNRQVSAWFSGPLLWKDAFFKKKKSHFQYKPTLVLFHTCRFEGSWTAALNSLPS